jgi:hypothetical protein
VTTPSWFTLGGWLVIVPADFLMSHDMLHIVKQCAEALAGQSAGQTPSRGWLGWRRNGR